ncbi:MAG: hypothetical protein CMC73_04740 [Flavobacteriaceae bacterium]|jgi:hypothetical protein|nr:hypothetical protein [Flavobacteriaceae bacterium]|tara:strand:- start:84 stop:380 length:297 start_codon:yes stop_codon:yes gene_type:complete
MSETTETQATADPAVAEELAQNAQEAQGEQNTDLSIGDLNALKQIIDVASARGAFRPTEMEAVGKTYTRLNNFLLAVQAQQSQAPEGEEPAEGTETGT